MLAVAGDADWFCYENCSMLVSYPFRNSPESHSYEMFFRNLFYGYLDSLSGLAGRCGRVWVHEKSDNDNCHLSDHQTIQ